QVSGLHAAVVGEDGGSDAGVRIAGAARALCGAACDCRALGPGYATPGVASADRNDATWDRYHAARERPRVWAGHSSCAKLLGCGHDGLGLSESRAPPADRLYWYHRCYPQFFHAAATETDTRRRAEGTGHHG